VEYYLPAGTWTNYLTGETAVGPAWRRETHTVMSLPLWVRGGAVLPTGSRTDRPDYDYHDGLLVTVYPESSGDGAGTASSTTTSPSTTRVTSPETGTEIVVTVERRSDAVHVSISGTTDVRVRLAGGQTLTTSNGKAVLPLV
jgi:alpha-D-xyloside xylohydrolase